MLTLAICISTGQLVYRLANIKVERTKYPIGAVEFIARRELTGKMVCTFNWSQYVLAAVGDRDSADNGIQLQIDGRCRTAYSQEMLDMHFDFILGETDASQRYRDPNSGPFDPARVLNVEQPDLVLISRRQEPSVAVMEKAKDDWVLLYQDTLAQLWGRRSRYDDPSSAYYLPKAKREVGNSNQYGHVRWPAFPSVQADSTEVAEAGANSGPAVRNAGL